MKIQSNPIHSGTRIASNYVMPTYLLLVDEQYRTDCVNAVVPRASPYGGIRERIMIPGIIMTVKRLTGSESLLRSVSPTESVEETIRLHEEHVGRVIFHVSK